MNPWRGGALFSALLGLSCGLSPNIDLPIVGDKSGDSDPEGSGDITVGGPSLDGDPGSDTDGPQGNAATGGAPGSGGDSSRCSDPALGGLGGEASGTGLSAADPCP